MTKTHTQILPPDSASPANTCDGLIFHQSMHASLAGVDLAAEAAALEACQVSAMLANATLSLTNLRPDAMPRLLQRP
jgi:hypothetical protein